MWGAKGKRWQRLEVNGVAGFVCQEGGGGQGCGGSWGQVGGMGLGQEGVG